MSRVPSLCCGPRILAVLRAAYPNESLDFTVGRLTSTGVPITDTNGIAKPRIDLLAAYHAGMHLSGRVSLNGIPVCAMVLANGKSTFSCDGSGRFSLADVPLDDAGQITLFAWADNMNPYKTVFAPSSISTDMEVLMTASPCDGTGENTGGSISGLQNSALSGIIRLSGTSTPVCAFVLANGQSTFSSPTARVRLAAMAPAIIPLPMSRSIVKVRLPCSLGLMDSFPTG